MSPTGSDLSGKMVLVTGASSGIGLRSVERFAQRGATVALNFLEGDERGQCEIERLAAMGLKVIASPGDVSDPASAQRMVCDAISRLGGLDFLVNNAGTSATSEPIPFTDLDRMTEEFWQTIISTNLVGPFRCSKHAAAALRVRGGAIVNVASIGGLDAVGSSMAYGASKAGLINLTKNLARALAPSVRVNAVAPGYVETAWTANWPASKRNTLIEKSLLKRGCTPDDIAKIIDFLCVDATAVTGQTIIADAGYTLG